MQQDCYIVLFCLIFLATMFSSMKKIYDVQFFSIVLFLLTAFIFQPAYIACFLFLFLLFPHIRVELSSMSSVPLLSILNFHLLFVSKKKNHLLSRACNDQIYNCLKRNWNIQGSPALPGSVFLI
jgi:hypothetical protein